MLTHKYYIFFLLILLSLQCKQRKNEEDFKISLSKSHNVLISQERIFIIEAGQEIPMSPPKLIVYNKKGVNLYEKVLGYYIIYQIDSIVKNTIHITKFVSIDPNPDSLGNNRNKDLLSPIIYTDEKSDYNLIIHKQPIITIQENSYLFADSIDLKDNSIILFFKGKSKTFNLNQCVIMYNRLSIREYDNRTLVHKVLVDSSGENLKLKNQFLDKLVKNTLNNELKR